MYVDLFPISIYMFWLIAVCDFEGLCKLSIPKIYITSISMHNTLQAKNFNRALIF